MLVYYMTDGVVLDPLQGGERLVVFGGGHVGGTGVDDWEADEILQQGVQALQPWLPIIHGVSCMRGSSLKCSRKTWAKLVPPQGRSSPTLLDSQFFSVY